MQIGSNNRTNTNPRIQLEHIQFGKYKSGNKHREVQIGKNIHMQTRKYKPGNTNRNIQIEKIQIGEIQFWKYKSIKYNLEVFRSGNTLRKRQAGKYKSETTNRKIRL